MASNEASDNYVMHSTASSSTLSAKFNNFPKFDFYLLSAAKFNGNTEQNTLEDKLECIIEKIQAHTTNYKNNILKNYKEESEKYNLAVANGIKIGPRDNENKMARLKG